jgi:hypothetical protein
VQMSIGSFRRQEEETVNSRDFSWTKCHFPPSVFVTSACTATSSQRGRLQFGRSL